MPIRSPGAIKPSEITAPTDYFNRRQFVGLSAALAFSKTEPLQTDALTSLKNITNYNNFYELGPEKDDPARHAHRLRLAPWTLAIDGLVKKPGQIALETLLKNHPLEERIYRLRCVERWSMVIPWVGFPLASLIRRIEPLGDAKFVEFTTLADPGQMPGLRLATLHWPYIEGLRIDEAMHPLTLLAVGLYGQTLLGQNGAPLRLVLPWKYGYKSIKSIVRMRFVEKQPKTAWETYSAREYGFYSNVNPEVEHPRWSQRRERRIGEFLMRETLPFNGYAAQVAGLYAGMDLAKYH